MFFVVSVLFIINLNFWHLAGLHPLWLMNICIKCHGSRTSSWCDKQPHCLHGWQVKRCNLTVFTLLILTSILSYSSDHRVTLVPTGSGGSVHWGVVSLCQEEGGHHTMGSGRGVRLITCQTAQSDRNNDGWKRQWQIQDLSKSESSGSYYFSKHLMNLVWCKKKKWMLWYFYCFWRAQSPEV